MTKRTGLSVMPRFLSAAWIFSARGGKFVVHNDDSVFADGGRDIPALAFQHINVSGNFSDLDLDFGPVGSLFLRRGAAAAECGGQQCACEQIANLVGHGFLRTVLAILSFDPKTS